MLLFTTDKEIVPACAGPLKGPTIQAPSRETVVCGFISKNKLFWAIFCDSHPVEISLYLTALGSLDSQLLEWSQLFFWRIWNAGQHTFFRVMPRRLR